MTAAAEDSLLEQTLERVLAERFEPDVRQEAEETGWAADCWEALAASGQTTIGVPESAGGSGGTLGDTCTLLRLGGRHAVPLPLSETTLLGGWLVAQGGLSLPHGPVTVAVPHRDDTLTLDGGTLRGRLTRVPWAEKAAAVAAVVADDGVERIVLVDPAEAAVIPCRNLAGEPRDIVEFPGIHLGPDRLASAPDGTIAELALRGALGRAVAMAGALQAIADLTVGYSSERRQFGRPIAAFQAVGQRLVCLVAEAEAASLAAAVASQRFAETGPAAAFEVAAAKVATGRAASEVSAHAHQVHGAIGMTQEYPLHHFTRRLWVWRQEWGSPEHWASVLGGQIAGVEPGGLWSRIASGLVSR